MSAIIVGWGHTQFGRLIDHTLETMILQAAGDAIAHAGVDYTDIDAIFLGQFNAGMVDDGFASSLALNLDESLRYTPATRLENACASGSAAVFAAQDAINSGRIKTALVIGAEKMTGLDTIGVTKALSRASYQEEEAGQSFPQIFAQLAQGYFDAFGDCSESLAKIAVKNHHHAVSNPLAQMQKDVSFDFCNETSQKNPMIAPPLRLTDCSLISDGAAAMVMVSDEKISEFDRAVRFRASVQMNDFLPLSRRDMTELSVAKKAFHKAYEQANITVDDIDCAEVHDCFTIAELMVYEAMGLAEVGKGTHIIEGGISAKGGACPINPSGGLKAKGHPVGATGVSMHVLSARQVTGEADEMQVDNARLAMVFNMGGAGVANYVSILEAVK